MAVAGGEQLMSSRERLLADSGLFVRRSAGLALRDAITTGPSRRARLHLASAVRTFEISQDLRCEHVGVRLRTDHSGRGDLRVTLRSPSGTVSVLQRYNAGYQCGPADWTYWSTQHFFEPSAGTWELRVTDEAEVEGAARCWERPSRAGSADFWIPTMMGWRTPGNDCTSVI